MKGESIKLIFLIFLFVTGLSIGSVAYANPSTLLYIDPEGNTANVSESFDINVTIAEVVDMYSWAIKIGFNGAVLEVTSVTEGPFLKVQPGGTYFIKKIYTNYIDCACTSLGAIPGVSGSGVLMTVTFHVKAPGESVLDIYDDYLLDSTLSEITHDTSDGYFYSTAAADLVRKSAWPEHHHFVISKHGPDQMLYGKVKNLASVDLYIKVVFDIVRDDGDVVAVESDVALVAAGAIVDVSGIFGSLTSSDAGKYAVNASCWFSHGGAIWIQGEKIKSFSFAVLP